MSVPSMIGDYTDVHQDTIPNRPFIHRRYLEMARKAGIENPALYVGKCAEPGARCLDSHTVLISNKLLNLLSDREVVAVLGHELGHQQHWKKTKALNGVIHLGGGGGGAISFYALAHAFKNMDKRGDRKNRREFLKLGAIVGGTYSGMKVGSSLTAIPVIPLREYIADDAGVLLSGDPESFISAMKKIEKWHQAHEGVSLYSAWKRRIGRLEEDGRSR